MIAAAILAFAAAAHGQSRPATVRGGERVFIRRGPGLDFQAFATVERGEQVDVEEISGEWALVRTNAGRNGYMHGFFLAFADGALVHDEAPQVGAVAAPEPTPAIDLEAVAQQNDDVLAEVRKLRADVESAAQASSGAEDLVELRAEVRRLASTTDALRSRLDAPVTGPGAAPLPEGLWSTSSLVGTSLVALLLGWIVGGAVSRRQERSRRSRIRF